MGGTPKAVISARPDDLKQSQAEFVLFLSMTSSSLLQSLVRPTSMFAIEKRRHNFLQRA